MSARLALTAILGLVVGGLVAVAVLPGGFARLASMSTETVSGTALVGGPFSLVDHTGKRVTDADYRGRHLLVYFGFTHCPDICPSALQVMSAALDSLGAKADRVQPILITVDPERDTPEQLALYVPSFGDRLVGLTGTAAEIANVAKAYRVYFKKVADAASGGDAYTMDHTSIVYLMAPDGGYVTHFTHATKPDQMAARIAEAL